MSDAALTEQLASWLGEVLDRDLASEDLCVSRPTGGGWSNDTLLVDLDGPTDAGGWRRLVVRMQPERASMFPRYDLDRQLWCLRRFEDVADVPTPSVLADDLEGDRLGRPAFVMGHLDGRIPADDTPTFAEEGWLRDATAADQRHFHCGLLDAVAALHRADIDADAHAALAPATGADSAGALDVLRSIWEFDRGGHSPSGIDEAFADLGAGVPEGDGSPVILWGDARPANVVVAHDEMTIIGLLDWELASLGPPELDVIWLEEMNWLRIEGAGLHPLPGFLAPDEAVAYYEEASGRRLTDLGWHRHFAALRVAVLMHRYLRALAHAGRIDPEHPLFSETVASRRLATRQH